jgi:hypothetical protein
MKNKLYLTISLLILGFSLFMRLYHMENRAPFDWDQNRDYQAISSIAKGKITLIGPVAKGEGGFFLGPLYYYLVVPAYKLMNASPSSLPLTSILIDVITVAAILFLLRKTLGDRSTLIVGTLWSVSWFAIEMSRISWNVALVPLWSVLMLTVFTRGINLTVKSSVLLGLIVGLSWHIHAALIPLSVFILLCYPKLWARQWQTITGVIIGYLIPLSPLILFDVRHNGLNYHLFREMVVAGSRSTVEFSALLPAVIMRLGKNLQAILLGISGYNLLLGYFMVVVSLFGLAFTRRIFRLGSLIILVNLLGVLALREVGFPEYYFAACYLPMLILVVLSVSKAFSNLPALLLIFTLLLVYLNVKQYRFEETSFGLSRKIATANLLTNLNRPIDLNLDLAPGREGGIVDIYKRQGGKLDVKSPLKIVVTDQSDGAIILDGELTEVIGNFGGIRVSKIVVQ